MPDSDDNDDDTREKYGIVGGKATVEKLHKTTDDENEENADE